MATAFEAAGIMERQQSFRGIRVVLACTGLLNDDALRQAIDQEPDICIVGEARDWDTLLEYLDVYVPEVVLLGYEFLPKLSTYFTGTFPLLIQVGEVAPADGGRTIASLSLAASSESIVETVKAMRVAVLETKWRDVMQMLQASRSHSSSPRFAGTIEITDRSGPETIAVSDICCITAAKNYVRLETAVGEFQTRIPISEIGGRLDPAQFIRVHRSIIVRKSEIETLIRREGYCVGVVLKNGRRYPIGSTFRRMVSVELGADTETSDKASATGLIY